MKDDREHILSEYQRKLDLMKKNQTPHKDVQVLSTNEVLYFKAVMHPTAKQESKALTKALIQYLCDKGICTSEDIYRDLGYADKPVLSRLKKFKEFGLVRREAKKYYMPTPRMLELKDKFLERVCG